MTTATATATLDDNWIQLDLFAIADSNEWQEQVDTREKRLCDLVVGDRVYVKWGNGVEFEGNFCSLGFWDGRDRDEPSHFFIDIGGDYRILNPYDEWVYLGHDETYEKPRKADILELLTEELRAVPFEKRGAVYRAFENRYPYTSIEYHPVIVDAWRKALIEVTTLDEVVSHEWTCPARFPKEVEKYIREYVYQRPRDVWMDELFKIRWLDSLSTTGEGYFINFFSPRQCTIYKTLFLKLIPESRTPGDLIKLMRAWGQDMKYIEEGKPKQKVWIEE